MTQAGELRSGKGHRDENFPVASHLIAARFRAPILAFYEFVRVADDIADHPALPAERKLELLDRLEAGLLGTSDHDQEGVALRRVLAERSLAPRHAQDLIAAFRLLRKRTACKLVVTGIGCEKYREEYRLEEDGTADDVRFLGWVEPSELPLLYNLAHGLFFPSVYEEFGIPVCEAMACGCPPVVSQTGALPEVAGDAGLIVDPFNPAAMADALERLWTNPALRADLVQRCLARAAEFTWDRCAQDTLTAFNRLA